jgi:uncharacterized protein DUF6318
MQGVWRLRGLAAIVLVGWLAAACTGSDATPNLSPVSSAPQSSVAASSASVTAPAAPAYPADVPLTGHNVRPGEKPPVYPAAATAHSQAGANAFAEFFMRTLDWAYATTNPSYARHYSGATCGLCNGLAVGIDKTAARHLWYEGGRFAVHPATSTAIAPVTAPADYCSLISVDVTAESVVDATGKIYNGDGAHSNLRFKLCAKSSTDTWLASYLARS